MHGRMARRAPILIVLCSLPWVANATNAPVTASMDLGELVRREAERAAEQLIWDTFRKGDLARARRYFQRKRYKDSANQLASWLEANPEHQRSQPVRFLLASSLERLGLYDGCATIFAEVAAHFPAMAHSAHVGEARCRLGAGQPEEAMALLGEVPGDAGMGAEASALLAWSEYRFGEASSTLARYQRLATEEALVSPMQRYV